MSELFSLDDILPNPYQPREREDPEHVRKIALSIAAQGLLQTPVGRRVDGRVELAFGHTRLAAFRWLQDVQPHSNLAGDFSRMPVEVRELSDLEMFEMTIRENIDRNDLTPVEQAKAMLVYRQTFGKTSAEIGVLFDLSESAVRNKMRLVDLPAPVQEQLSKGQLTEGQARELLTVARVAAPEKVVEIAGQVAADPSRAMRVMEQALDGVKGAVKMWEAWRSGDPRGGDDLWPLSWTWEGQRYADWKAFQKFWKGAGYDDLKQQYEHASRYLVDQGKTPGPARQYVENQPANRDDVQEAVEHLFTPPACTACPFYARHNGNHYCGARTCWERKKEVWSQMELERVSRETGISVYDPHQDGAVFEELGDDYKMRDKYRGWYDKHEPFLRLRLKRQSWWNLTGCALVQVISVGTESLARIERLKSAADKEAEEQRIRDEENAERGRRIDQTNAFLAEAAAPVFAQAFRPLQRGVLISLAEAISYGPAGSGKDAALELSKRYLARLINNRSDGPVVIAEHLQGLAKSWGLDLPADWLDLAGQYAGEA